MSVSLTVLNESDRVLFLDEYMVESIKKAQFALMPAVKVAQTPVIRGDRPWEGRSIAEATVLYDEDMKLFRMWYPVFDYHPPAEQAGAPVSRQDVEIADVATERKKCTACYAISDDGYHWEKPSLGLVDFGGSRDNNILIESRMAGRDHFSTAHVFRDPVEDDPSRLYKGLKARMVGRDGTGEEGRMVIDLYYSPDGFDWTPCEANPVYDLARRGSWGPTSFMGWDPIREVYAVYMENCGHQHCPVGMRLIGRAESPDMVHWSQSETILVPDEQDGPGTEFYGLHPGIYGDFCVGMLWIFTESGQDHYPQFVFSRDGIRFDRRYRKPFIERGESPSFDCNSICPLRPIAHGDEIFIYYIGSNYRTPESFSALGPEVAETSIGLAVLPRDGFVAIENTEGAVGEVVTRSLTFAGSKLVLNTQVAGARGGDLKAEIIDPAYFPIPGYTLDDADPVATTGLDNVVTWKGSPDISALAGKPIKLRLHLDRAKLFSLRFSN